MELCEAWRNRRIEGEHPYLYLDGIVMKRTWAGEVRNVSLLVASAVNSEGFREDSGLSIGVGMGPLIGTQKDSFDRRVLAVALALSELVGVAETAPARVV